MLLCFFVCFPTNFRNVSEAHSTHVCIPPPRPWYRSSSLRRAGKTVENFFNMIESRLTIKIRCTQKRRERWNYRIKIVNLRREEIKSTVKSFMGFSLEYHQCYALDINQLYFMLLHLSLGINFWTFLEWFSPSFFATLCPFCVLGQFSLHSENVS